MGKTKIAVISISLLLMLSLGGAQEKGKYPAPRFPSSTCARRKILKT